MAWIELHQGMPGHRKTRRVKSVLGIDTATAVGHLCLLWLWALDNAENGSIGGMLNQEIADVCEYAGDADKFVDALVEAGYLVRTGNDLVIHDWVDYCGRLMDKREKNRIRQQRFRERNREAKEEAPPGPPPAPVEPPEPEPVPEGIRAAEAATRPETAQQIDPERGRVIGYYMDRINPTPSSTSIEELGTFYEEMGADVCIAAMNYAIDERKTSWSYIRGTLRAYRQRGIKNMDDLRRSQEDFERQKQSQKGGHMNGAAGKHSAGRSAPTDKGAGTDPIKGFHTAEE
jgi:DnaD/phage-associated family protein